MGTVHVYLKRSFIAAASVIAVISVLLLGLTLVAHGVYSQSKEYSSQIKDIHYMYIVAIIPLVLTIFGLFGACKKKKWALIVFAVGMILMSLILFFTAVIGLTNKSEIADEFRKEYMEIGPLSETSDEFQQEISDQQLKFKCCGLHQGYIDWGNNVPESCECTGNQNIHQCVELRTEDDEVFMVYEQACLPYLVEEEMEIAVIVIGVMMALSLLWVLSVVLCIVILCKLSQKDDARAVVYHSGVH